MSRSARLHADGKTRCPWPGEDPFYMGCHDTEWGGPEYDDRGLYEKLILDGCQAGLSWITILRKRENFRKAFDDFQPAKIARYNAKKVHALMNDAGIVRNRAKIEGTVNSAKSYLKIMERAPASRNSCGISSTASQRSTRSRPPPACRHRHRFRSGFPRSSARAGSNSSVRPSSTPSCRRPAWSTTIWSPASATRAAAEPIAAPASRSNDGPEIVRLRYLHPGLAADAVGAAARSLGSLAARYRNRRYRPWPRSRRTLERADQRRAYLLGGAAHAAGRGRHARADAARRCHIPDGGAAARRARICHRRYDLA